MKKMVKREEVTNSFSLYIQMTNMTANKTVRTFLRLKDKIRLYRYNAVKHSSKHNNTSQGMTEHEV